MCTDIFDTVFHTHFFVNLHKNKKIKKQTIYINHEWMKTIKGNENVCTLT